MQRPRHGSHDVHGDGPGVVADKGDLAVALVGRAVNSMLPGLAAKAADLVSGGWREAAANVLVEEHLHAVALDKDCLEGVVVISPLVYAWRRALRQNRFFGRFRERFGLSERFSV